MKIICTWGVTSVLLLSRLSLCFWVLAIWLYCIPYKDTDLIKFTLFGVCWASWMYVFMSFIRFRKFWPLFLQIFFLPICIFSFWNSYNVYIVLLLVSIGPLDSVHFSSFLFFFLLLRLGNFLMSNLEIHWFFLLLAQIYCWIPLWVFHLLYFQLQNFFSTPLHSFHLFIHTLILFRYHLINFLWFFVHGFL